MIDRKKPIVLLIGRRLPVLWLPLLPSSHTCYFCLPQTSHTAFPHHLGYRNSSVLHCKFRARQRHVHNSCLQVNSKTRAHVPHHSPAVRSFPKRKCGGKQLVFVLPVPVRYLRNRQTISRIVVMMIELFFTYTGQYLPFLVLLPCLRATWTAHVIH